jgi:hypothetical protein
MKTGQNQLLTGPQVDQVQLVLEPPSDR